MPASNVIAFSENVPTMSCEEGLAFIERTRRQLDRFEVAFPLANGQRMPAQDEANIREILDELEAEIRPKAESI